MQDIPQETHHETTRLTQSAQVVLWEIDLAEVGGERYFFCNEQNEKGEPVIWQGRQYQVYPIQGTGFELNGKGSAARPTLTVSNLHGMVTGMAEDLQSLVGGTVVRRKVYARFLDAVNFVNGNSDADPEQEVISRWRIEQCSELSAVSASFVLSTPTETDGAVFPGRIMLANTCTWTYRGDECGYHGPAVADEYDQPTSDNGKQNTYFSSLDNMVAQGNVLPVLYGEMRVGSRVISQEISTADEGDGGQVVVIGR
ncbi:phage minor tail protein L [Escherichia coli]